MLRVLWLGSPFEQFEVIRILGLGLDCFDVSLTNSSLLSGLLVCLLCLVFRLIYFDKGLVGGNIWQGLVEGVYVLVLRICRESIGLRGSKYVGVLMTLFTGILGLNLLGMIPYSYCLTSQLIVSLCFALGVWLGKLLIGLRKHGVKLFGLFLPEGLPFGLIPFFVIIEIVGFIIPVLSLSVRLFANMMSGHVLLKVLFGFIWIIGLSGVLGVILQLLPLGVLLGLIGLEVSVSLIQAYVFSLLTCIYVSDMESGGH